MFSFNGEKKSIDKSMILYYKTHGSRQRINNKPIRVGCNIWILADNVGQCKPNESLMKEKQVASTTYWRLGENAVLQRIACSSPTFIHDLFINNYFTSFRQMTHLGVNIIRAAGVLNINRLRQCLSLGTSSYRKTNLITLNSAHQAQKVVQLWQWCVDTTTG